MKQQLSGSSYEHRNQVPPVPKNKQVPPIPTNVQVPPVSNSNQVPPVPENNKVPPVPKKTVTGTTFPGARSRAVPQAKSTGKC